MALGSLNLMYLDIPLGIPVPRVLGNNSLNKMAPEDGDDMILLHLDNLSSVPVVSVSLFLLDTKHVSGCSSV
jgi:hypothetical protein